MLILNNKFEFVFYYNAILIFVENERYSKFEQVTHMLVVPHNREKDEWLKLKTIFLHTIK